MNRLELFPTTFYEFKNTDIDNDQLITKLKKYSDKVKLGHVISSLHVLHNKPEFTELFSWIGSCLESVRVEEKYDCDRFDITNSWFNVSKAESAMAMNYHRHSMSFYSGVYYTTHGAPTVFEDPVIHRTQAQIEVLKHDYRPTHEIFPEPGKLIIFPSWIYHYSWPHTENFDRTIISFNSLPAGEINFNLANDSKVHLEVKS
jgi:uncharacterized protein (TIGR02466 family)